MSIHITQRGSPCGGLQLWTNPIRRSTNSIAEWLLSPFTVRGAYVVA